MKDLSLLVWIGQLGLNVAAPFACAVLAALWMQARWGWGQWVLWVGILLGVLFAIDGFRSSMKALELLSRSKKDTAPPPVSFNDHD